MTARREHPSPSTRTGRPPGAKIRIVDPGDVWFFAYGSLMWEPGFPFADARPARLFGYHRAFCVDSKVYRGTPEEPGLVLGLDRGGSCIGRAYLCRAADRAAACAYLQDREMQEDIYACRRVRLSIDGAEAVGYAFVVDRDDVLYAGKLAPAAIADRIARCRGRRGANAEYLENTIVHLDALGIPDGPLHDLLRRVQALTDDDLECP